jgi:di/tricarboxylate transporter
MARHMVSGLDHVVTSSAKPLFLLGGVYLVTMVLTEVLSNNAVAALMIPIAIGIAKEAGFDPRGLIIAVTIAASCAFATPIGYQTNTYVYGIGGYRFSDFLKVGLPLNFICFAVAMLIIPWIWPF